MTHSQPPKIASRFGPYGGRYVPETLIAALDGLREAFAAAMASKESAVMFPAWILACDLALARADGEDGRTTLRGGARRLLRLAPAGLLLLAAYLTLRHLGPGPMGHFALGLHDSQRYIGVAESGGWHLW